MTDVTLVSKVRIYPSESEAHAINSTMHLYTTVCDYVSDWVFEHRNLKQREIHDALYYAVREQFGLGSQLTQSVFKTVISKYKTIHTNHPKKKWEVKPSFNKHQIDLVYRRNYTVSQKDGNYVLSVSTIEGRIKNIGMNFAGVTPITEGVKLGTAKVVYKHGCWFIHIPMTFSVDTVTLDDVANIVGIDLGINFLATSYDSKGKTNFVNGKSIKHTRARYKNTRAQLQQKGTKSAKKRLKTIGQRETRWMTDINHQASKALCDRYAETPTLFVIEDLTGIRNATEKVRVRNRYVSVSWAFHQFRQFLEYKATKNGHLVVAVDPRYTSQICPKCGHTARNNRNKKTHVFCCKKCGYTSNDDRVAAMNLHNKGIEYRMQSAVGMSGGGGDLSTSP